VKVPRGRSDHRKEFHGATYKITPSDRHRHAGDPQVLLWQPPGYEHPQRLGPDVLGPGGPRVLSVSQQIEHGPERSREEEFEQALREDAAALHTFHSTNLLNDRRREGRRYRETDYVQDLLGTAQVPYQTKVWQADVNRPERFLTI
jgi:hypothetical protein